MAFRTRTPDTLILFSTRIARMFAYGFLSVVLALYLAALGFDPAQIGLLFTLALIGDAAISLWLTTSADLPSGVNNGWWGEAPTGIWSTILLLAGSSTWTASTPAKVK